MENDFGKMSPAEQAFFCSLSRKLADCRKIEKMEREGKPTVYMITTDNPILDELLTDLNEYLGAINEDLFVCDLPTAIKSFYMSDEAQKKWNAEKEAEKE